MRKLKKLKFKIESKIKFHLLVFDLTFLKQEFEKKKEAKKKRVVLNTLYLIIYINIYLFIYWWEPNAICYLSRYFDLYYMHLSVHPPCNFDVLFCVYQSEFIFGILFRFCIVDGISIVYYELE